MATTTEDKTSIAETAKTADVEPDIKPDIKPDTKPKSHHQDAGAPEQQRDAKDESKVTPARQSKDMQEQKHTKEPSARRERKQTAFFQPEKQAETAKLEIKEGDGTKLGDIPNIVFRLSKVTGRDELLEDLHQLCYGSKGKLTMRKKEIQAFSGYTADATKQEAQIEKSRGLMSRFHKDHMTRMLDLLDIPRSDLKDKESRIDKIVEFLKAPAALSGKDLAGKEAQKKAAAAKKRQRKQKEEAQGAASTDKPKKAKKAKKDLEEEAEDEAASAGGAEDEAIAAVDDKSEDATEVYEAGLPADPELEKEVLAVLSTVDVHQFNIKMLMTSLNAKYKTDLKDKKPFIKQIAIGYCAKKGLDQ